jgi:glutamate--cysteine ligase
LPEDNLRVGVDGALLGVKRGFHAISLEPGGQFEVSAAPQKTIQDVQSIEREIDRDVIASFDSPDWRFIGEGFNRWQEVSQIQLLPSPRYRLMDQYFSQIKSRGQEMMRKTCGIQVNMDFSSEIEGLSMLQTGFRIAPVLSTLFSNSRAGQHLGERQLIWEETDSRRSGFLKDIFHPDYSFEHYIETLSKLPLMYAFDESDKVFDPLGKSLANLSVTQLQKNILSCSRQIFTHVRFKPCCVEMRFLDQQEEDLRFGVTAMVVGLIYDDANRDEIAKIMRNITVPQLEKLMHEGSCFGFKADGIYKTAIQFLKMAENGLIRRGFGEESYLAPVEDLLRRCETPAERSLRQGLR